MRGDWRPAKGVKITLPSWYAKEFKYPKPTDVQATWRRFGWIPPSEAKTWKQP
jgi:hypothetical protein